MKMPRGVDGNSKRSCILQFCLDYILRARDPDDEVNISSDPIFLLLSHPIYLIKKNLPTFLTAISPNRLNFVKRYVSFWEKSFNHDELNYKYLGGEYYYYYYSSWKFKEILLRQNIFSTCRMIFRPSLFSIISCRKEKLFLSTRIGRSCFFKGQTTHPFLSSPPHSFDPSFFSPLAARLDPPPQAEKGDGTRWEEEEEERRLSDVRKQSVGEEGEAGFREWTSSQRENGRW